MFFREVLNDDLGCASYMVADGGEAVIIDPKCEVDQYLQAAKEDGFRISHILETHNHADYLSGKGRLAKATGAKIHISKDAGVEYEHESLEDGDVLELGSVRIVAVARSGSLQELAGCITPEASRHRGRRARGRRRRTHALQRGHRTGRGDLDRDGLLRRV